MKYSSTRFTQYQVSIDHNVLIVSVFHQLEIFSLIVIIKSNLIGKNKKKILKQSTIKRQQYKNHIVNIDLITSR